jgi:hypothetical protein
MLVVMNSTFRICSNETGELILKKGEIKVKCNFIRVVALLRG